MKKYITAFCMTQSMFCSIPFPMHNWDEDSRPYMLLFLPLVGLEIGVLWFGCHCVLGLLNIPFLMYAFVMCVLPFVATGFIHLDGFMDVVDAVSSCRSLEKRREILKDSHVGSFAVVWCVILFLAMFACFGSAKQGADAFCLLFVPAVSRVGSALAVINLKSMSTSQYAQSAPPKWHNTVLIVFALFCIAVTYIVSGRYVLCLALQLAVYGCSLWRCYKSLQGMNGDILGFCITVSEVCAVAAWALLQVML